MRAVPDAIRGLIGSALVGSSEDLALIGGSFDEAHVEVTGLSGGSTHRGFHVAGRAEWFLKLYREPVDGVGREARVLESLRECPWVPQFGGAVVGVREGRHLGLGMIQCWVQGASLWDGFVAGGGVAVERFDWSGLGRSLRGLHHALTVGGGVGTAVELNVIPAELAQTIRAAERSPQVSAEERGVLLQWAEIADGLTEGVVPEEECGVIHGDLHLGQVLAAGNGGLRFIDFEGEPHLKGSCEDVVRESRLRDLAGMTRSIGYLWDAVGGAWSVEAFVSAFLEGYFGGRAESEALERFRFFSLQRAFREWCYEKAHRPEWVQRPLRVPIF